MIRVIFLLSNCSFEQFTGYPIADLFIVGGHGSSWAPGVRVEMLYYKDPETTIQQSLVLPRQIIDSFVSIWRHLVLRK